MTGRRAIPVLGRLWPSSITGQLLLTLALALMVAQVVNAVLIYRGQREQNTQQIAAAAAIRIIAVTDRLEDGRELRQPRSFARRRFRRTELGEGNPVDAQMRPLPAIASRIGPMLRSYDIEYRQVTAGLDDAPMPLQADFARMQQLDPDRRIDPGQVAVIGVERADGRWLVTRVPVPARMNRLVALLIFQTILLYLVLLVPVVWLARRISRPLRSLQSGVAEFRTSQIANPLPVSGPGDVAALIESFNAMSARIAAMLDEKDVMLGAIGHDLKTPLAALRVRVESVEDDRNRERMTASIEDITRTLDDILALARIGRSAEAPEMVNLTAMTEMLIDEFHDLDQDVALVSDERVVAPVHLTWIRRAVRNLVSNAVRYGKCARVSVRREGADVIIAIEDDGPGIAEDQIEHMFEPFARLDASRNSSTGGTGLGLTLARAIAEQHRGGLVLQNRHDAKGRITGLSALLRIPATTGS